MCAQTLIKLMPSLLATTLVALACEQLPNPAAPRPPNFQANAAQTDRITGGGKLGDGRDFATFGFNARDGQGQIEWVQHCLDGMTASPTCSLGGFTFHGSTVTAYSATDDPRCRAWSGDGEAKFKDLGTSTAGSFSAKACDKGQPGRGTDTMCFSFAAYSREDVLAGGNIQLHSGTVAVTIAACPAGPV